MKLIQFNYHLRRTIESGSERGKNFHHNRMRIRLDRIERLNLRSNCNQKQI